MTSTILLNTNNDRVLTGVQRRSTWVVTLVLTMAAFALRFHRLDYLSLRGDEAFDVLFASQSLGELLHQFRFVQPYPPLFHVGLHFWLPVAGPGEFSVRFWAALCATLAVPAIYTLGSQLFGRQVGLVSASLAAVNPFIQWWGQDAHFYAYLLTLTTVLNIVALRFWRSAEDPRSLHEKKNKRRRVLLSGLYVLVALVSFLTHYFAYFTWGAFNLVALVQTLRRRWSQSLIRRWWSAQALLVIIYLPWVILTFPVTSTYVEPWIEQVTPWGMLRRDLIAFSLGYTSPLPLQGPGEPLIPTIPITWLPAFFAVVFLVGIILGWMQSTYRPGLLLTLSLTFVPLSVIYLTSFHRPIFDEKLTIFLLPFYLVVLSLGIVVLARYWRWASRLVGLAAFLIMSFASYQYFTNENMAKSPAWRELISYVNNKAQSGDLLVYNFPEPSILYYNDGRLPTELIPNSGALGADEISAHLEQAVAGYSRVWLVPLVRPWWDTRGDVITWLDRHADRIDQRFFRGVHVNLYLAPSAWESAMTPQPVTLAKGVQLRGFRLSAGENEVHHPMLSPGDTFRLSLYWQADAPTDVSYTVFTHLVGPDGQIYGQWDNPPVWGTFPTTDWSAGESVVDQYEIPVSPDAPPGEYRLLIGLYDPVTGARLPVLGDNGQMMGDSIQISETLSVQAR
jgi:mannosyltransferase